MLAVPLFQRATPEQGRDDPNELGRSAWMPAPNIHRIVRGLLAGDLVSRCSSPGDRRLTLVELTRQGERTFPADESRPCINSVSVDSTQLGQGNLVVDIGFKSPFPLNPPVAGLVISSSLGTPVFGSNPRFHKNGFGQQKLSEGILRMTVNQLPVYGGTYKLSVWLGDWQTDYDERRDVLAFVFKEGHPATSTPSPETIGFTDVNANWSVLVTNQSYVQNGH